MIYAPVLVTTLNRYEHLERCLNSLARNSLAKETEIYISVDYPPTEKYVYGYNRVKEYFNAGLSGFKNVHLYYQEKNLGPKRNFEWVREKASNDYDCYIYTEDDNEFSPNFLDYINKGIELFEHDDEVIGICGFKDTDLLTYGNNVTKSKLFPAYGFGTWFKKENHMMELGEQFLIDKKTLSFRNVLKLYRLNPTLFCQYISGMICTNKSLFWNDDGKMYWCDSARSIYMFMTSKTCIVPKIPKSRTWGNDGSGVNMPNNSAINPEQRWVLDIDTEFEYSIIDDMKFDKANYRRLRKYLKYRGLAKDAILSWMKYFLLLLCGKDRNLFIKRFRR